MSTVHAPSARPGNNGASPAQLVASGWRNRGLILQLARRDILGRYGGSALRTFCSPVDSMLMLTVYTFFFSVVFRTRGPKLPSRDDILRSDAFWRNDRALGVPAPRDYLARLTLNCLQFDTRIDRVVDELTQYAQ